MIARLKSNRLVWAFAALAVLVAAAALIWALQPETTPNNGGHATWVDHYYSPEEMVEKADLILTGKVVQSDASLRIDIVVTTHQIQTERVVKGALVEGDLVPVLQTGGTMDDGYTTPAIVDAPLFEKGEKLLLFLQKTDEGHYLVMGGYQGVGRISLLGRVRMQDPADKAGSVFHGLSTAKAADLAIEKLP